MGNIPPDHELRLARAKHKDRERNLHLTEIESLFKARFSSPTPLDNFALFPEVDAEFPYGEANFRACIFFKKDSDVAACEADGTSRAMRDFVYENLEEFGRGKRGEFTVAFEFDSFENVERNYQGNYLLRLR